VLLENSFRPTALAWCTGVSDIQIDRQTDRQTDRQLDHPPVGLSCA